MKKIGSEKSFVCKKLGLQGIWNWNKFGSDKNFWARKIFWVSKMILVRRKKFECKKMCWFQKILGLKIFWVQKNLRSNRFLVWKSFRSEKYFLSEKYLVPKKKFTSEKNVEPRKLWVIVHWPKISLYTKSWPSAIPWTLPKVFSGWWVMVVVSRVI